MRHTWRWFGPIDKVTIADARQAGAEGIVTALHHIPYGSVWAPDEIERRKRDVSISDSGALTGLQWEVVESLPISEDIKTQTGSWRAHIDAYRTSMQNLAAADIKVICYNFMPVLDWTRTDLYWRVDHGGTTMRFDLVDFAAFDIHILKRKAAPDEFPVEIVAEAAKRFATMDEARQVQITRNIRAGLPGATEITSLDSLRVELQSYADIDTDRLRSYLIDFLSEVTPLAESLGLRLCCHPDDPPFPLLGLPRIMSTEEHYRSVLDAVDSPANGMTYCTGSLGARADNDLPGMITRLGSRIHFAHLRNVHKETAGTPCSFHEAEHLTGDTDMIAVIQALLREEERRKAEGRADCVIPMRPDHGQDILEDAKRNAQPGYPAIGRLKALAELRGVERALTQVKAF